MKITLKRLSICLASAGMLTIYGCGGGGGGGATPATSTPITVAPSLGKFTLGTPVKLTKPDGTELAAGSLDANGKYTFNLTGYTGPIVVEVQGGPNVQYYDEGTKKMTTFGVGKKLRAMMPTPQPEVGVTALTNAAVIKLDLAGTLKTATATTVGEANTAVANALKTLLGLSNISILQAPTLVDKDTGKNLNAASVGDQYAIALAAFAKTATGTNAKTGLPNDASDAAEALANDLKDGNLDGQDTTTATPTTVSGYDRTTISSNYKEATHDLAEASSETVLNQKHDNGVAAASTPTSGTSTSSGGSTTLSDLSLAKAMFAELRTTLNSFANGSKTGFLDTQATSMNADMAANVAPEVNKVANRISALNRTMSAFEDAKGYALGGSANKGFAVGTNPLGGTTLVRYDDFSPVIYGYGSAAVCWTDSAAALTSKMTCAHAGSDSYDAVNHRIKMVTFELTSTATNQYSYTATRYNLPVTVNQYGQVTGNGTPTKAQIVGSDPLNPTYIPAGSGTIAKTVVGTTQTGLTLNGTLPPSATAADGKTFTTGVDTVAISAVRTPLTTANNFHYALSGSVSTTNLVDAAKVVTLSFDNGSFFDADETNALTTGSKVVLVKLVGTAKTAASTFTGTLDANSFSGDKNGKSYQPTSIAFTGSISGAGQTLTGIMAATVASYGSYDSSLPDSSTNYLHASVTFTGSVQAPSRPLLQLVVADIKTGPTTGNVTVNYSYGTVSITGSGVVDSQTPSNNTLTLSNQDGIQILITNAATSTVKKSGNNLATITNGSISYIDGVTESLN